jgi:hypothetical protein
MKQRFLHSAGILTSLALLVLFAGCNWFGKKGEYDSSCQSCPSTSGEPLICFGTKIVFTFEDFKKKIKMLQEAQPGIEAILASMPEKEQLDVYVRFAQGCVAESLGKHYVIDRGLANATEFKEMARQAHEALDGQLYMQAFQNDIIKEHDAIIEKMADAELRSYYEQNRDKNPAFQREPFMKRRGEKDSSAKEYAPFEEVREQVRQAVKQAKLQEFFEAKLEELKQKYGVKVEEACLAKLVVKKDEPVANNNAAPVQPAPTPAAPMKTA